MDTMSQKPARSSLVVGNSSPADPALKRKVEVSFPVNPLTKKESASVIGLTKAQVFVLPSANTVLVLDRVENHTNVIMNARKLFTNLIVLSISYKYQLSFSARILSTQCDQKQKG